MHSGNWHPLGDGYIPQPGDVAVYGDVNQDIGTDHVGIYVSGSASAPTVVNGNGPTADGQNNGVMIYTGESSAEPDAPNPALAGYVSP